MAKNPRQPADETPLILTDAELTGPAEEKTDDAAAPPPPEADAVTRAGFDAAISAWESGVLPHIDAVVGAITDSLAGATDSIRGETARVGRVVSRFLKGEYDKVVQPYLELQAENFYPAMGTQERRAELSVDGTMMMERIVSQSLAAKADDAPPTTTLTDDSVPTPRDDAPRDPRPDPTGQAYCTWVWVGGAWVPETSGDPAAVDPTSKPSRPGSYPGEIVVVTCRAVVPPSPPPAPPTAPTTGTQEGPCPYWTVGPDRQDPDTIPISTNAPPYARPLSPEQNWNWYTWPAAEYPGQLYAYRSKHLVEYGPPGGGSVIVQPEPDPSWVEAWGGQPCDYVPSPPPPAPPSPPTVPPTTCKPACEPPIIQVVCPPPAPPTVPPPTKPSPPTTPEPSPPSPPSPPTGPPTTPDPKTTVKAPGGLDQLNWDNPAACGVMSDVILGGVRSDDMPQADQTPPAWMSWLNAQNSLVGWWLPSVTKAAAKAIDEFGQKEGRINELGIDNVVGQVLVKTAASYLPASAVPNKEAGLSAAARLGIANRAESLTGIPLSYMMQSYQYLYQGLNPQMLPGQGTIDSLYLSNRITKELWWCLTSAQGNLPNIHFDAVQMQAQRPIASEIIDLRLRDIIRSDDEYLKRMREVGWVQPEHAMEALKLKSWIPGPGNLIRYMVRDAADKDAIELGKLDTDFDAKYNGQIERWGKAQGVEKDVFRYEWYSHWEYPSNTAVYEMVKRLRQDRDEVMEWQKGYVLSGYSEEYSKANPRPPVFTIEDARRVLKVNDMAPAFIDSLLAVAYHPVTNSDARRAFMIGFRDKRWLVERMKDNGYDQADSDLLAEFFDAERERTIGSQTGILSARKTLGYYKDGVIDALDADRYLADVFPDPEVRRKQIRKADVEVKADILKAAKAGIRKGYVFGEYDDDEAIKRLSQAGFPESMVPAIIAQFRASRMSQKKEPRVRMICEWYTHRLITEADYYERVIRLGYTADDAYRIVQVCSADKAAKAAREALQAAERARKEAKSNLAELKRQIEERQKQLKELEKRLKDAQGE